MAKDEQNCTFDAFISHASADQPKVKKICKALESKGVKCWIAPRNVTPGADYSDEIMSGIENSRCLVLVLSKSANEL